jgi:hypothetical protein
MELVESDASIGQVKAYVFDEGGRHVDADRGDLLGFGVLLAQVGGELLDGGGVPPFGNAHDLASDPARFGQQFWHQYSG